MPTELHVIDYLQDEKDFRVNCSCGYFSVAFHSLEYAERAGCAVEEIQAQAAERRRKYLKRRSDHAKAEALR